MNYKNGLKILELFVKPEDTDTWKAFNVHKAKLLDNLNKERLFSSTETLRSDRAAIVYELNPLAHRLIKMSFVDLCVDSHELDKTLQTLLRQTEPSKARQVASLIVYNNKLSSNKDFLDRVAIHYQVPLVTDFGDEGIDIGPTRNWRGSRDDVELQSFLKPNPDMMDVGFLKRAMERTTSVCQVEIPQLNRLGTGFLIAPTLMLTNYHVLGNNDEQVKENARHVVLRFGYITANDSGQTFKLAAEQPILSQSPANNGLDYALLRVDNSITEFEDIQPAPYDLNPPTQGMGMHILQHPQGGSMKFAINNNGITGIYQSDGLINKDAKMVDLPRYRTTTQ